MKYDQNTEYWPEGNTVIDRDGNVVLGQLRADGIRSEVQAKLAADLLNSGKSKDVVRKALARK